MDVGGANFIFLQIKVQWTYIEHSVMSHPEKVVLDHRFIESNRLESVDEKGVQISDAILVNSRRKLVVDLKEPRLKGRSYAFSDLYSPPANDVNQVSIVRREEDLIGPASTVIIFYHPSYLAQ